MPSVPRNGWNVGGEHLPAAAPRPIAASWSHTPAAGTAPNSTEHLRWPPKTSWAWRDGIIHPPINREKPGTPTITDSLAAWPCPSGISHVGLPQIPLGELARRSSSVR